MSEQIEQPRNRWLNEARAGASDIPWRLRLAAMSGHMQLDRVAHRRAALVDLLADGRPHSREEIWQKVEAQLGEPCWGKVPKEALARDLAALRKGGLRIAYSRHKASTGYYLQYPAIIRPAKRQFESLNWQLLTRIAELPVNEKNVRAFAAADFALNQKKLILAEANPHWTAERVDMTARGQQYGEVLDKA